METLISPIDVIAATAADVPDIARIFTAARAGMVHLPSFPTADEMVPVFAWRITQGNVLLARCAGRAVGFAQLLDGYVWQRSTPGWHTQPLHALDHRNDSAYS